MQKKRLADAERTLASKTTKAAAESKRIATNKIEKALTRLDRLKATKPHVAEARIFPMHYAPIVLQDGDRRVMRLGALSLPQARRTRSSSTASCPASTTRGATAWASTGKGCLACRTA